MVNRENGRFSKGFRTTFCKERVTEAVANSTSINGVLRYLKVPYRSGNVWLMVRRYIAEYDLDTSHFVSPKHNLSGYPKNKPASEILVFRTDLPMRERGRRLRKALHEIGREYRCVGCGLGPNWNGQDLVLEVDHINGDWRDNRAENLRFLCPNCHSQRETSRPGRRRHDKAG